MNLLDWDLINIYDYKRTKKNVDCYIAHFMGLYYKYINTTPKIKTSFLNEVRVDGGLKYISCEEDYVETKDENEKKYRKILDNIHNVYNNFTSKEKIYFSYFYFFRKSENEIREKLNISINGMNHVKKSAIIKFALAFKKDVENR